MTAATYHDSWIDCTLNEIRIRGYYFLWGTKHIPYATIQQVREVAMSPLRGKGRIWGTASPKLWANLDPHRSQKSRALILDIGARINPYLTPDDVDAAIEAIKAHTDAPVIVAGSPGPII
jgi:hypothetical protein